MAQIDAIMVVTGWDYEGSIVLGLFTLDDELGAFAFMLEQMNRFPARPDYMQIVLHKGETATVLQKWIHKYNEMNNDGYWQKEV